jgi:uncharacterized protein
MEMNGQRQLGANQQQAWDALNDPAVLKQCVAGCEKMELTGQGRYAVGMAVKIGPVSAKFTGNIEMTEVNAPDSYTLNFDGQGGVAGFGKGSSKVVLTPNAQGTLLDYTVNAQVGGKIAQLGQRLIDGVAKNMADDFFVRFDQVLAQQMSDTAGAQTDQDGATLSTSANANAIQSATVKQPTKRAVPTVLWVVMSLALIVLIYFTGFYHK